ncbi:MAG: hypothetical protein ACN6P1_20855 [Pseudomonas sp.]|uniref:hypothetical protein n=1 Tax=Pseudomonas sp. TaxID=306 RepID=UPI003D13E1B7
MKADWDDAPRHMQSKGKGTDIARWIFSGLAGCAITFGILYFASGNLNGGLFKSKPVAAEPESYSRYEPLEEIAPPQKTSEQIFWENVEADNRRQAALNAEKQNVFNDNNYQPKQVENTYSPPTYQQAASSQVQTTRVQRERDGYWIDKWSGGARYYAEWEVVNNYIEGTSVCANHRRGSIDYRECRKGAKQFFKEQCKGWSDRYKSDRKAWSDRMKQRYCSAASNFNPMG